MKYRSDSRKWVAKMKFMRTILPILIALALALPGWSASDPSSVEDVQEQIQAVAQRLEQVRPLVEESRNAKAISLLEQGERNLEDARKALLDRKDERQARNFIRRALELINAAAQEASRNRGISQDQAERELNRLQELIRNTDEVVGNTNLPSAQNLLDQARKEAEQARQLTEEGSYRQAMERIRRSTELARKAGNLGDGPLPIGITNFDKIIEELDQLITEAAALTAEGGSGNPASPGYRPHQTLDNALQLRNQAVENYQRGQVQQALDCARRAKELAQWLLRQEGQAPADFDPVERAQRELNRANEMYETAQQIVPPDGVAEDIENWLTQAQELMTQAETLLAANPTGAEANRALAMIQEAIQLINKASYAAANLGAGAWSSDLAQAAQQEYRQLVTEILPGAVEQVRQAPNERAVRSLEQAQLAAERAKNYIDRRIFDRALQEIDAARTLARRAIAESGNR